MKLPASVEPGMVVWAACAISVKVAAMPVCTYTAGRMVKVVVALVWGWARNDTATMVCVCVTNVGIRRTTSVARPTW